MKNGTKDENFLDHCMGIFSSPERQKDLRIYQQQKLIREKSEEAIRRVERETCREAGLTSAGGGGQADHFRAHRPSGLRVRRSCAPHMASSLRARQSPALPASSRMSSSLAELMSALASSQYNAALLPGLCTVHGNGQKALRGNPPGGKAQGQPLFRGNLKMSPSAISALKNM